jgi:GGDEF domain-containing protein
MQQLFFMIRINHFDELQSMIGPERAAAIQRQVFNVVRSVCRTSDKVLPCHRDECGAIAWVSDPDNGSLLADRIQEHVRSQVFNAGDGFEFGLTCSIGFSANPAPGGDPDLVLWKRTVKLARSAVESASRWPDDAWVGYLGSNGPPPAATDVGRHASEPDNPLLESILPARTWSARRRAKPDRRAGSPKARSKPLH